MNLFDLAVAACVSLITGVVTYRVLRECDLFGKGALPIAICGAALAAIGLQSLGHELALECIPWTALGIALLAMFLGCLLMRLLVGLRGESCHDQDGHKSYWERTQDWRRDFKEGDTLGQRRVAERKRRG